MSIAPDPIFGVEEMPELQDYPREPRMRYWRRVSPKITRRRLAGICIAQAVIIFALVQVLAVVTSPGWEPLP